MDYLFQNARLPRNAELLAAVSAAAERLHARLQRLDVNALNISDYNRRYFGRYLQEPRAAVQRYSYMLAWALAAVRKPLRDIVLLDHGGGSGMVTLLAKELGVGTVIYTDVYDLSCQDAAAIGGVLGSRADAYIHDAAGDLSAVLPYFQARALSCDVVCNNDVIEHIYRIEAFLTTIPALSTGPLSVFFLTSANEFNPRRSRSLKKLQRQYESYSRDDAPGRKLRDTLRAYSDIRREMIRACAPGLSAPQVEQLTRATRGMRRDDLEASAREYLQSGQLPPQPQHPTNTCDPYTGNWMEHLMNPYHLARILEGVGFETHILPGYYGYFRQPVKRYAARAINALISANARAGLRLAPAWALYGVRR